MAKHDKYLVTVDKETGFAVKIEKVGADGELTEVTPETLGEQSQTVVAQSMPQPVIVNLYINGGTPVALTGGEGAAVGPGTGIPAGPIVPNVPYQARIPSGPIIPNWPWSFATGQAGKTKTKSEDSEE